MLLLYSLCIFNAITQICSFLLLADPFLLASSASLPLVGKGMLNIYNERSLMTRQVQPVIHDGA
jgi:hypothetical protein